MISFCMEAAAFNNTCKNYGIDGLTMKLMLLSENIN